MAKCSKIRNIVWLRQTLRRWRTRAAKLGEGAVPAGHVAVRVEGAGGRRFVVRVAHLNHPEFRELLRQAEEEYGFPPGASGPVMLLCDEERLRDVLRRGCCRGAVARGGGVTARRGSDSRPLLQGMVMEKLVW